MVGGLTVFSVMKRCLLSFAILAMALPVIAQDSVPSDEWPDCEDGFKVVIIPKGNGKPVYTCRTIENFGIEPDENGDEDIAAKALKSDSEDKAFVKEGPDYSHLTPKTERHARLDEIFSRLQAETDPDDANLIAEEIWALWLDSGSASIDFVLRRGSGAHKRKDHELARRMFDHVTTLSPDYAEGWARSSRLALDEKDLGRALTEAAQALVLEPRHFYALWTMGNVFEQLGRQDEALEAYREANKLYPELKAVKDRLGAMQSAIDGDVL